MCSSAVGAMRSLCCTRLHDACAALRARNRQCFSVARRAAKSSRTTSERYVSRHLKRASNSAIPASWCTAFSAQRPSGGRRASVRANVDSKEKVKETTANRSLKRKSYTRSHLRQIEANESVGPSATSLSKRCKVVRLFCTRGGS